VRSVDSEGATLGALLGSRLSGGYFEKPIDRDDASMWLIAFEYGPWMKSWVKIWVVLILSWAAHFDLIAGKLVFKLGRNCWKQSIY